MKSNEWPTVAARLTACTCVCECLHLCVNAIKELYAHMYTASLGHLNEVDGVLHQNSFSHSVQSARCSIKHYPTKNPLLFDFIPIMSRVKWTIKKRFRAGFLEDSQV